MNENYRGDAPAAPDEVNGDEGPDQLRQELEAARDRALRAQAELDNFRKRMRREMEDERRYACQPLLRDLLSVVDNIGRAAKAAEAAQDSGALLQGVKLVEQQLDGLLRQYECRRIEAAGAPFDPNLHAAVTVVPTPGLPPNTVVEVVQAGYLLHDRVLRPAQVVVSPGNSES